MVLKGNTIWFELALDGTKLDFLSVVLTYKFLYMFKLSRSDIQQSNCQGKLLLIL
jgi:hypothetical protein